MRRSLLSLVVVVASLVAGANAQVIVSPEGWASWPAPGMVNVYAPMLVTPVAHLETPQASMGATAAAPGQQVGATSFPTMRVLTPTPPSIIPRVVNAPPTVFYALPQPEPPLPETVPGQAAPNAAQARQPSRMDLGIARIDEVNSEPGNRGLAEAAGAARGNVQSPAGRSITNADVIRLNEQTQSGRQGLQPQPNSAAPAQ